MLNDDEMQGFSKESFERVAAAILEAIEVARKERTDAELFSRDHSRAEGRLDGLHLAYDIMGAERQRVLGG